MIIYSKDNIHNYNMLEKADVEISDFTTDCTMGFESEKDFCIVVYFAKSKDLVSFVAKDYIRENTLIELKEFVEKTESISTRLLNNILDIINDMIADTSVFRFYLDAH